MSLDNYAVLRIVCILPQPQVSQPAHLAIEMNNPPNVGGTKITNTFLF